VLSTVNDELFRDISYSKSMKINGDHLKGGHDQQPVQTAGPHGKIQEILDIPLGLIDPIAAREEKRLARGDSGGGSQDSSSDATPSVLSTDDQPDAEDSVSVVNMDDPPGNRSLVSPSTTAFILEFEKTKSRIRKMLHPQIPTLRKIVDTARRNRFLSEPSKRFLEDLYEEVQLHLKSLSDIERLKISASHTRVIKELRERCERIEMLIQEAVMAERGLKSPTAAGPNVAPTPAKLSFECIQEADQPGSTHDDKKCDGNQKNCALETIRAGTRVIRYPPAPLHALRAKHALRAHSDSEVMMQKLLAPIPPSELAQISQRRRLFLKHYGPDEGEKRFCIWLQSQTLDWNRAFYVFLEDRGLTLTDLLSERGTFIS
jgi:hypothetical protein